MKYHNAYTNGLKSLDKTRINCIGLVSFYDEIVVAVVVVVVVQQKHLVVVVVVLVVVEVVATKQKQK